jgi:glycosyltransferase involved in cell wall biosynthesis
MTNLISSKPLVTALICNYNYGRFLAQAIDSALNQTWEPIEVLVVDDGSTDESRSVLERYRGRIKVILKENGGQASAFNVGIAEARGEIICFLDSDDFWFSDKVETTVVKYKEAPWGLVCHDLQEVNENGINVIKKTHLEFTKTFLLSGDLLDLIVRRGFPWVFSPTSGMSLSSQVAKKIFPLPEQNWRISADVPLAYSAICHAPVGIIDKPLSAYRYHGVNSYASIRKDRIAGRLYDLTSRADRYFFLKDNLNRIGVKKLINGPKRSYRYYRQCCFIVKKHPWNNLLSLWKQNINYHFDPLQGAKLPWFNTARYLILDTILSVLTFLHIPTPYNASRIRFRQEISKLRPGIIEYLETDIDE